MTRAISQIVGPLAALLLLIAVFFAYEPLRRPFGGVPPPVEKLTVERTVLDENGIALKVRADGTEPVSIAQVQVDGAYWQFAQDPSGAVPRLASAWIKIPYPWVEGETHKILFVTRTGLTFEHEIAVAWPTPKVDAKAVWRLTLAGIFLGVVPVALGMLFYPALKSGGKMAFQFAMALTIGLLAFLLVDTLEGALEAAGQAAPGLNSVILVWIVAGLASLLLWGLAHWKGEGFTPLGLATSIAFAIGVHNLGEGLAVGSAFATGAAALGGYLLLGFRGAQCDGRCRHYLSPTRAPTLFCDSRWSCVSSGATRHFGALARRLRLFQLLGGVGSRDWRRRHPAGHHRGGTAALEPNRGRRPDQGLCRHLRRAPSWRGTNVFYGSTSPNLSMVMTSLWRL